MRQLLAREPHLDAVFAASDLMAAGALQVLQEAGPRVPEDVALIGFDDAPIAITTRPTLSSVRQSLDAMGRELVTVLLASIDRPDNVVRKVVLATRAHRPRVEWRAANGTAVNRRSRRITLERISHLEETNRAKDDHDPLARGPVGRGVRVQHTSRMRQVRQARRRRQPQPRWWREHPSRRPGAASLAPTTLRVLVHQNPPFTDYMKAFNAKFEAHHPGVKVEMSVVAPNDLATITQTRLAAKDVDVVDMFAFDTGVQSYMKGVTPPIWQTPGRRRQPAGPHRPAVRRPL